MTTEDSGTPAGTAEDQHPDAELLRLKREIEDASAAGNAAATDEEAEPFLNLATKLRHRLAEIPAHTLDGVIAKFDDYQRIHEGGATSVWDEGLLRTIREGLERLEPSAGAAPTKADWLGMFDEYRERMGDEAAAVRANQHDTDAEYRATEIATEATQSVEHRIAEAEVDGLLGLAVKLAVLWNNSVADTADSHDDNALVVGSALDYLVKQTGIDPYVTYDRDCNPIRQLAKIRGAS